MPLGKRAPSATVGKIKSKPAAELTHSFDYADKQSLILPGIKQRGEVRELGKEVLKRFVAAHLLPDPDGYISNGGQSDWQKLYFANVHPAVRFSAKSGVLFRNAFLEMFHNAIRYSRKSITGLRFFTASEYVHDVVDGKTRRDLWAERNSIFVQKFGSSSLVGLDTALQDGCEQSQPEATADTDNQLPTICTAEVHSKDRLCSLLSQLKEQDEKESSFFPRQHNTSIKRSKHHHAFSTEHQVSCFGPNGGPQLYSHGGAEQFTDALFSYVIVREQTHHFILFPMIPFPLARCCGCQIQKIDPRGGPDICLEVDLIFDPTFASVNVVGWRSEAVHIIQKHLVINLCADMNVGQLHQLLLDKQSIVYPVNVGCFSLRIPAEPFNPFQAELARAKNHIVVEPLSQSHLELSRATEVSQCQGPDALELEKASLLAIEQELSAIRKKKTEASEKLREEHELFNSLYSERTILKTDIDNAKTEIDTLKQKHIDSLSEIDSVLKEHSQNL